MASSRACPLPYTHLPLPTLYLAMPMYLLESFSLNFSTVSTLFIAILQLSVVSEHLLTIDHAIDLVLASLPV